MRENWQSGNMLYPLPAVMVSCKKENEKPNIITLAWAGTICSEPPMVSISVRPHRYSYRIIKDTGEFVINLVNKDLTFAMDWCGVKSGKDFDKFKEMGLSAVPSTHVMAPTIGESPLALECRVKDIVPLGSHDMFISDILGVSIDPKYMGESGKYNLNDTGLVAYSHGEYFLLGEKLGKFGFSVRKK